MVDRLGDAHLPLRTHVADELRRRITDREYPPGTRLVEHAVADELGVSRNPVREAIRVLEQEGFVHTVPRRGVVVAALDATGVAELFQVRAALEGMSAELACRRIADGQVDETVLATLLERSRAATEAGDVAAVNQLNSEFHAAVVDLAGNRLLGEMMRTIRWRVRWVFRLSARERAPHSWSEHAELLDALRSGEPDRARATAIRHVQEAERAALDAVDTGQEAKLGRVAATGA